MEFLRHLDGSEDSVLWDADNKEDSMLSEPDVWKQRWKCRTQYSDEGGSTHEVLS